MDVERQWRRKMKLQGNTGCCHPGIVASTTGALEILREAFWRSQGLHFHGVIQIGPPKVIWYKFLQKTRPTLNSDWIAQGFDPSGQERKVFSLSWQCCQMPDSATSENDFVYVLAFLNVVTTSKKTSRLIPKHLLVALRVEARVKALGYSKEGDGEKQQWCTELIISKTICICNRDKNLYFRSSKVLSVFFYFLTNILDVFLLTVILFSYLKLCLFIMPVIRLIHPTISKKLSKCFWYVKEERNKQ